MAAGGTLQLPSEDPQSPTRGSSKSGRVRSKNPAAEARVDQFLERQSEPTPQYLIRRATSKVHRELVEVARNADDAGLLGNQGPEGFRKLLAGKYGSVAAAWRIALDPDGNGKISFGEMNHRCRQIGFTGNLRKLWSELEPIEGFISLKEIDPKAYQDLEDFRAICMERYGNMLNAWKEGFNPENLPGVSEKVFISHCQELGFAGDCRRLFKLLRIDWSRRELKLEDFDPQTGAAVYRADPCAESISYGGGRKATAPPKPKAPLSPLILSRCHTSNGLKRSKTRHKTTGSSMPGTPMSKSLSATLLSPTRMRSKANTAEENWETLSGTSPVASPKSTYGQYLDLDSTVLTIAMGEEDLSPSRPGSKARSLRTTTDLSDSGERWDVASPTRNSNYIRNCSKIQVLDRVLREEEKLNADVGMKNKEELVNQLGLKYGSLRKAWQEVFDPFDTGKIGFQEFCDRMRAIGFLGNMKDCWRALGAERDGVLRLRHLDRKTDELMLGFKLTLTDKYGNMLNAWKAFDPNGLTLVEEAAFVKQCQADGVEGDLVQLFHELMDDPLRKREFHKMSLREFDLEAYKATTRNDPDMIVEAQKTEKRDPLEMSFDERQENMFSVKWTRAQSKVSRQELTSRVQQEEEADVGCKTLKTLKTMLIKKYKNLAIAWRVALDPMGQGHLSKEDWFNAVRNRIGFHGDLRQLWKEVAKPNAGHVSLTDLDPHAVQVLWDFRALLLENYGDIMTAWHHGLDPKKRGKLEEEDFAHRVKEMGYEGDIKKLWQLLLAEPHRKYIVLRDIDPAAAAAYFRGDDKALTLYGTQSGPQASPSKWTGKISVINTEDNEETEVSPHGSPTNAEHPSTPPLPGNGGLALPGTPSKRRPASHASSRAPSNASVARSHSGLEDEETAVYRPTRIAIWSAELGERKRAGAEMRSKAELDLQVGPKCLDDYRRQLVNISGSLAGAWRYRIDPECTGRQTFMQFVMAIERTGGYSGSVKQLWEEISADKDEFTFQDLDPHGFELLQAYGTSLLNSYETFGDFWKSLQKFKDEQLDEEAFATRSEESGIQGLSRPELDRIFKMFLPEPSTGRRKLIQSDLDVLVIALNVEQKAALRHSTTQKSLEPVSPTSRDGGQSSPSGPSRLDNYRRLLINISGTLAAAWRYKLDEECRGRQSFMQFVMAIERTGGYTGSVKQLWAEIAGDKDEFTFQDLDPEGFEILQAFGTSLLNSYETLGDFWKSMLKYKDEQLDEEAFVTRSVESGIEGLSKRELKRIYKMCLPESSTGRKKLLQSDLEVIVIALSTEQKAALRQATALQKSPKNASGRARVASSPRGPSPRPSPRG